MIGNNLHMAEIAFFGPDAPKPCFNPKCRKPIGLLQPCFLDSLFDRTYCRQCGLCLRYARKKAVQRGELVESVEL